MNTITLYAFNNIAFVEDTRNWLIQYYSNPLFIVVKTKFPSFPCSWILYVTRLLPSRDLEGESKYYNVAATMSLR